ncbi:MAG: hypothetical protein A3G49_02400 [Candidatus Sungbacteria bacterium RIFCSPLOWO2_12_FULL_41_11]|uniref:Beta-ketoacyl-[acyl-carrier-protein] synthase III C-terminal domain-containing protein n=1 Tax=Candidatus Sungbacteria bacterium RIFCSPLOWO2_12_FULL_41_11 TaxID=1802286 RepID=A0A1G2LQS6_9BACT|nr:MAG: 3-oxoacyl-[acyl-carrier-protein] synthase 3 [Parcubacteria group bacterium GW2011_GWA2_42_14]OHA13192.1 MAG: hypothetical protein A3G49_02400 [Candidatus Sungbacteria bacterium RIFCSPLOWO2_12_FULL_41_11]
MKLLGTGLALPSTEVKNEDIAFILPSDVIERKTGIRSRYIVSDETVSQMAAKAVREACQSAKLPIEDIQHIVCSTNSGEQWVPPTVARVARHLGYCGPGFDINAACVGSITALRLALFLPSPSAVVATEHVTPFTVQQPGDWPSVIFGDGAGAAVIEAGKSLIGWVGGMNPEGHDWIQVPKGGYCQMNGPKLLESAIPLMTAALTNAAKQCGLHPKELDIIIPHQANLRIIEACMQKWNVSSERVIITVDKFGNTSSASVLMALAWANLHGKIRRGQWIGLVGFGAGLIWEALVTRLE